jgi:hypothetical protein
MLFIFSTACAWRPAPLSTPAENDDSIIFPLSVGREFVEVAPQKNTYQMEGEVLRALMVATNDYFTPAAFNGPCWARPEAHTFRFTRRDNVVFVYVEENWDMCDRKSFPIHSGAKYAISTEGRILRRVTGSEPDHGIWRLKMSDGGTVTVVAKPGVVPDLESLETPDGGILKILTEPVNMPDVMILEPVEEGSESKEVPLGSTSLPPIDAGYKWEWQNRKLVAVPEVVPQAPASELDGGTPDAGWDGGTPKEEV